MKKQSVLIIWLQDALWGPSLVIIVPADDFTPLGARPSTSTVLITAIWACGWPGNARNQVFKKHDFDLISPEYSCKATGNAQEQKIHVMHLNFKKQEHVWDV